MKSVHNKKMMVSKLTVYMIDNIYGRVSDEWMNAMVLLPSNGYYE